MGLFSKFKARLKSNTKASDENQIICTKFVQFTESPTSDKEINYAFDVTNINKQSHSSRMIVNKEERKKARPQSMHLPEPISKNKDNFENQNKFLNPSKSFNNKLNLITNPNEPLEKNKTFDGTSTFELVKKANQVKANTSQLRPENKSEVKTKHVLNNNIKTENNLIPASNNIEENKVAEMNEVLAITKSVKFKKVSTVSSIDSDDVIHLGNQTNVRFVDTGDSSEEEHQLFPVNIVPTNEKNNLSDIYYSTNDEEENEEENEIDTWQQEGYSSYASNIFFSGIHSENDDDNEMSQC